MSEPTIVVQFGEGVSDDSLFKAELDGILNVDSVGEPKTSFYPGDDIFIRVHYDETLLEITSVAPTDGEVFEQNVVTRESEEQQLFTSNTSVVSLTYKPSSTPEIIWYGNSSEVTRDGREMTAVTATDNPCMAKITHNYKATIYRWRAPDVTLEEDETWPMALVFIVDKAPGGVR